MWQQQRLPLLRLLLQAHERNQHSPGTATIWDLRDLTSDTSAAGLLLSQQHIAYSCDSWLSVAQD